MKPFRRWPSWMQQVMTRVVVGLFVMVLARCVLDLVTGRL